MTATIRIWLQFSLLGRRALKRSNVAARFVEAHLLPFIAILIFILAVTSSCSLPMGSTSRIDELPPVERLRNTGSFRVSIDTTIGLEGEYSVPLLDGPFPAVVLANDGSLTPDQVKDEARLLARHGFGVLGFTLSEAEPLRQFARAGATVIEQPGISSPQAALVLLSGDPLPAIDVHRRLSGFRVLVLIDPESPPLLTEFVEIADPMAVLHREDRETGALDGWRDGLSLVGARTRHVLIPAEEATSGILSPSQRDLLARTIIELLQ